MMATKRYEIEDLAGSEVYLGRVGENGVRIVEFDVRPWLALYPGSFVMVFVTPPSPSMPYRPGQKPQNHPAPTGYIAATEFSDGIVSWTITANDTRCGGKGAAELILYGQNGEVMQSTVMKTRISESISHGHHSGSGCGCGPSPMQPWVDQVAHLRMDAEYAAERAEEALEDIRQISIESTIPEGGEKDQVLVKLSDRDGDFGWVDLPEQEVIMPEPCKELVISEPTMAQFPRYGDPDVIYKAEQEGKLYQWNADQNRYEPLTAKTSIEDIIIIHGGNAYGTA